MQKEFNFKGGLAPVCLSLCVPISLAIYATAVPSGWAVGVLATAASLL